MTQFVNKVYVAGAKANVISARTSAAAQLFYILWRIWRHHQNLEYDSLVLQE